MRLVQITIPAGKREAILRTLDEEGIDYVLSEETSGREFTGIAFFPLPTNAVEDVLDSLEEAGLDERAYTVVVDAEFVMSRRFEQLSERYAEEEESEERIARQELTAKAQELSPRLPSFLALSIISAVVATAGVLLDSPAVVVGSMVIAPLIGPAMATSVGTVVDDSEMFVRGLKLQILGFTFAVASAAGFAALARGIYLVPPGVDVLSIDQVEGRLNPDFLSLAVALGAGAAGALSLSTGVSTALVGVMIAVALIPPTAVIGIGIAWGLPRAVIGSTVLVLVNVVSINLSALAVLWYQGYRPAAFFQMDQAKTAMYRRTAVLVGVVLLLSVALGAVTYTSYQQGNFEDGARTAVTEELATSDYRELSLIRFEVQFDDDLPFQNPSRVAITVGRPAGESYPELPSRLQAAIESATGNRVEVQVVFVELGQTSPGGGTLPEEDDSDQQAVHPPPLPAR